MDNPLLTVYITNYNYGLFIRQAIESVLNQSFKSLELLIIDDGSTDNSREIIEKYADFTNVTIIYQKNKGLNITNNVALQKAAGKYIMRLDADDYLREDALEKMVGILEKEDDLGMVFPDYFLVNVSNEIIAEIQRHDFTSDVSLYDQPAHGACTLIRTDYLKEVGGYDESYTCQDGYELWIKFSTRYKVLNVSEPLFYYRRHGQNLTSNEHRILGTRRRINRDFIKRNKVALPKTLGLIPLRGQKLKGKLLTNIPFADTTLIEYKVDRVLESQNLEQLVLSISDRTQFNKLSKVFKGRERVVCMLRPEELAKTNVSLTGTLLYTLETEPLNGKSFDAVMTIPLEFPFISGEYIDDAIHSLEIFQSDSLITVREEHNIFYQHRGSGMEPILDQNKFTRLERESLFKGIGGITLSRLSGMKSTGKMLHGKVGHIIVEQKPAIAIFSAFELKLAQMLAAEELKAVE